MFHSRNNRIDDYLISELIQAVRTSNRVIRLGIWRVQLITEYINSVRSLIVNELTPACFIIIH